MYSRCLEKQAFLLIIHLHEEKLGSSLRDLFILMKYLTLAQSNLFVHNSRISAFIKIYLLHLALHLSA